MNQSHTYAFYLYAEHSHSEKSAVRACLSAMRRAGCATATEALGLAPALKENGWTYHPYMRRRLSLRRLANLLVKGHGSGLVVNLIVGIIGGILGGWVLSLFGLVAVGTAGSLIASVAGAVILLWIARAVTAPAKKRPAR